MTFIHYHVAEGVVLLKIVIVFPDFSKGALIQQVIADGEGVSFVGTAISHKLVPKST